MAAALPLGKLLGLAVKSASKPLASRLRSQAKQSEGFERACERLGNALHRVRVRVFRVSHGDTSQREVKDLPKERAVDSGASFIGEAFVYLVAAGVTVAEYSRQKTKEGKKAQKQLEHEQEKERELMETVAERDRRINALMEVVPVIEEKIDFLRADFEKFQGDVVKALQLLNLSTPSLADLQGDLKE